MYQGLQSGEERAAKELTAIYRKRVRKPRLTKAEDEDVAYQAIKRVIEPLATVRKPASFSRNT